MCICDFVPLPFFSSNALRHRKKKYFREIASVCWGKMHVLCKNAFWCIERNTVRREGEKARVSISPKNEQWTEIAHSTAETEAEAASVASSDQEQRAQMHEDRFSLKSAVVQLSFSSIYLCLWHSRRTPSISIHIICTLWMLLLSCLSFIFSAHWKIIAIICHPSRLFYLFHALFGVCVGLSLLRCMFVCAAFFFLQHIVGVIFVTGSCCYSQLSACLHIYMRLQIFFFLTRNTPLFVD